MSVANYTDHRGPVVPMMHTGGAGGASFPADRDRPTMLDLPVYRVLPDNRLDPTRIPILMDKLVRHEATPFLDPMRWYERLQSM